jgi:tetratricopeptide (TPR) repeat protein
MKKTFLGTGLCSIVLIASIFLASYACGEEAKEDHFSKGTECLNNGMYDNAIAELSKAIEINPNNALAYNNRGSAYYSEGRYDQAISDYSKAIDINPTLDKPYYSRGLAYGTKKNLDQAMTDYTKAIDLNPSYNDAYYMRGLIYYDKGNVDQAISDYTKAIEINPNDGDAYYARGLAWHKKNAIDKAINDYTKAMTIKPQLAPAYVHRAYAYFYKKNYDKAWEDIHKAEGLGMRDAGFVELLEKAKSDVVKADIKSNATRIVSLHFVADKNNPKAFKMLTADGKEELYLENTPQFTLTDIYSARLEPVNLAPEMLEVLKMRGITPPRYRVSVEFTPEGKDKLYKVTSGNINKRLGIIINNQLLIAPVIKEPLSGGEMSIQGALSEEQMKEIVEHINKAKGR